MRYLLLVLIIGFSFPNNFFCQQNSAENFNEDEEYISLEGKIINSIIIRPIDVAGESINGKYDNNDKDPGWFGRLTNSIHFKTRDWVIKNRLLFKEGDKLTSKDIGESERLLRNSGYFLDARIRVNPSQNSPDSVSVFVTTKEKWTITPLISYNTERKDGYLGLRDDNFIGLGHKVETTVTHDQNKSVGWGFKLNYTASNVLGTFIDAGVLFETNRQSSIQGLNFVRPFITTETEWAGGLDLIWETNNYEFRSNNQPLFFRFRRSMQDIWIGKSYPVWFGSRIFKVKTRFVTSARIARSVFTVRPIVTSDTNRIFENYNIYLFNFGIINRRFYRDYFIEKFGVTEDIPIGGELSFTIGSEAREFSDRLYLAFEAIYSRRIEDFGYISADIGISGFRRFSNWEQNVFIFNLIYHSQLSNSSPWKLRFVAESNFLLGFNRFRGEQIYLDQENGIRGFEELALFGTKKTTLNLEARIFSPFSPLGFSIGGLVFADLGLISPGNRYLSDSRLFQAYGIGFRTRNESIARTNFEISLVYNPYNPTVHNSSVKILFTGSIALGIREFGFSKPAVIPYGAAMK